VKTLRMTGNPEALGRPPLVNPLYPVAQTQVPFILSPELCYPPPSYPNSVWVRNCNETPFRKDMLRITILKTEFFSTRYSQTEFGNKNLQSLGTRIYRIISLIKIEYCGGRQVY